MDSLWRKVQCSTHFISHSVAYAFQIITEKSAIALHGDVAQLGHVAIYHGACCSQIDNLHAVLEIFQIGQKYLFLLKRQKKRDFGLYDKKRPEISCTPFIYYSFGQKLFDDKKSAFVAALIAPLKRVRRMVISVGFVKTVNAIL